YDCLACARLATTARNVVGGSVSASNVSVASGGTLSVGGSLVVNASGQVASAAGSAFAPASHTHDAADVVSGLFGLARIPSLDLAHIPNGSGSGLNADLLDGKDS